MSSPFRLQTSLALLIVASLCLLLSPALSFMAGCAGDTKGGSLGNIELALHYGGLAILVLVAGMSIGTVGVLVRPVSQVSQRSANAGVWLVLGGILSWVAAFQAEGWGVQYCF